LGPNRFPARRGRKKGAGAGDGLVPLYEENPETYL